MRVTLRRATLADSRFLWRLRNSADVRAVSGNVERILWSEHSQWFAHETAGHEGAGVGSAIFVILANRQPVGYMRGKWGIGFQRWTVSIAITRQARGKGIGKAALSQFVKRYRPARAVVKAGNEASLALFRACGFKETSVELELL